MADNVRLQLEALDVYGRSIPEKIDIFLRHQVLGEVVKISANAASKIEILGLHGAPQGLYRIQFHAPSYQYVSRFINLKAVGITSLTVRFPIDPGQIKTVKFPTYSQLAQDVQSMFERTGNVLSFEGKKGKDLYDALDPIRRAGVLNIVAKMGVTLLSNNRSVLSYVQELKELRGDRFFAVVPKEVREETKNSVAEDLFYLVNDSLHHPPPGFSPAGSFKTPDHYGSLQLTFFMNGNECVADIDIDDGGGLQHVFQVLPNKLSGSPTHPYNVHEILVGHQQLDPGYTFVV